MKRSGTIARRTGLRSHGRIRTVNRKRRAEKHARNFGEEAERVRAMPCLCNAGLCDELQQLGAAANDPANTEALFKHWCRGRLQTAHVTARGMGGAKGGRFDLVPLCDAHHREAGEAETSQRAAFEQRYGLDLRAEADRVAVGEHLRPLGIRGLAQRWTAHVDGPRWAFVDALPAPLDDYERSALLGWVRREMAREIERRTGASRDAASLARHLGLSVGWKAQEQAIALVQREQKSRGRTVWDGLEDNDREAIAHHVAQLLGGPFTADPHGEHGLAWTLCGAAGWPS